MIKRKSNNIKYYIQSPSCWLTASFLVLAILSAMFSFFRIDIVTSTATQSINQPWFDSLMVSISRVGDGFNLPIFIAIVTVILIYRNLLPEAITVALASSGSALLGYFIKILVNRPRPDPSIITPHVVLTDRSFPSHHVLVYTVFFGLTTYFSIMLIKNRWPKLVIAMVGAFLIATVGLSRVYLGAHWLSDVLGGYLLGILCLNISIRAYRLAKDRRA